MTRFLTALRWLLVALFGLALFGIVTVVGVYLYLAPTLPDVEALEDVRLQVPLRVHARGGELIAEYGEMKRTPVRYADSPDLMIKAFLAAEDDRFFEHPGVDYQGLLRAAYYLIRTGQKGQGGSTITMQVARNFFLSREKTYLRKISEIFLALKIERELSKERILELYLNKIYLGHRAYGVGAAAQIYYGRPLKELSLPQFATIAGLPKAPSRDNPVTSPERAKERRAYVLRRMYELGFIDQVGYLGARAAPVTAELHRQSVEVEAPYIGEMVRSWMVEEFGKEAYTAGYRVHTTLDAPLQKTGKAALRRALLAYGRRHGYRGPAGHVELADDAGPDAWRAALEDHDAVGNLVPGVVTALEEKSAEVFTLRKQEAGEDETRPVDLTWEGMAWARPYRSTNRRGPEPKQAKDVLAVGDLVYLEPLDEGWRLAQVPKVAGALVSVNPDDGAIRTLVGGFDYYQSKFNRATQARRQPGSNFKPFIYSAALANGFTTASIINDAPVVFEDKELEATWRPENYSGRFYGPTRLREALIHSRNLVSIRILRQMGTQPAVEHIRKFGFAPEHLPRNLSLALGSANITPVELVRGYAVLANGGYRVAPYFIAYVENADGEVVRRFDALRVCREECQKAKEEKTEAAEEEAGDDTETKQAEPQDDNEAAEGGPEIPIGAYGPPEPGPAEPRFEEAERTVDERNVYLVTSMMRDVVKHGTGRGALKLGRDDLAGKTGTTNEQRDAWFSGFNRGVVTTAWVGFDNNQPLGSRETGARAALPMWVDYMRAALAGMPEQPLEQPPGLVTARIDPETGEFVGANTPGAIFEVFREENVPEIGSLPESAVAEGPDDDGSDGGEALPQQLF